MRPLAVFALLASGCFWQGSFRLSGSITAPPRLQKRIERPNTALFIVATNEAGIPIAVKRIINPKLPLNYRMAPEDLVLPGPVWKGRLAVKVHVNSHGRLGIVKQGDLQGSHPSAVRSGDRNVNVVVDQEI